MRARVAHIPTLLLALTLATLLASSCSRELPTAQRGARSIARTHAHRFDSQTVGAQIVVTLVYGADPADVADTYNATILHWDFAQRVAILQAGEGDTPANLLAQVSGDPRVLTAEGNGFLQPAETSQQSFAFDDGLGSNQTYEEQPAAASMQLGLAHETSTGSGVKIAILDTGIDPNHPVFQGHIAASYDFVDEHPGATDVPLGVDTNGDGYVDGGWGHGSHVAGIALLAAPDAQLLVGRVLDSDGVGDVMTVAAGIRWAVNHGADIVNLSLGTPDRSAAISQALAEAEERGVLVIVSAGNHGAEFPQDYPARSTKVRAIAAVDAYRTSATWASYASYVSLSAPGVGVRSAYPGGGYRIWSGSSMSAPFVSGTAALVLQLHRTWSPSQVMSRLRSNADPFASLASGQLGKMGAGIVDAGAALAPDVPSADPDAETGFGRH